MVPEPEDEIMDKKNPWLLQDDNRTPQDLRECPGPIGPFFSARWIFGSYYLPHKLLTDCCGRFTFHGLAIVLDLG
jgi:hypothetical protein